MPTSDDFMRAGSDSRMRVKPENRPGRTRSQSMEYTNGCIVYWDASTGASKPLRWYPSHLSTDSLTGQSRSISNFSSLDTIDEDIHGQAGFDNPILHGGLSYILGTSDHNTTHTRLDDSGISTSSQRRHSDSDLLDIPSPKRYNKRRRPIHDYKRNSNPDFRQLDQPRKARRKSYLGVDLTPDFSQLDQPRKARRKSYLGVDLTPDYDTFSDASDAHSHKSSRSRLSAGSDESLSSASKCAVKRRSDVEGLSVGKMSKGSSMVSLVHHDSQHKQGLENRKVASRDQVSSTSSHNVHSLQVPSNRKLSALTTGEVDLSPFSTMPLPIEFLDSSTSRVRKWMSPVVITIIAVALLVCLTVAIYFAIVLKDSQDKQIEFLQVTLKFALVQEQQSHDFSSLTSREISQLKQAYCQQVNYIYTASSFTDNYRGCEVDTLTSEKIQFKLYFLDSSVPEKQRGDNIVEVLELRAQPVGVKGSNFRKISDITFDMSNKTRSVQVQKTKKAEDFYSNGSSNVRNRDSVEASSNVVGLEASKKDDTTIASTMTSTPTRGAIEAVTATPVTTSLATTTLAYHPTTTTSATTTPRKLNMYSDADNAVLIDTICSNLDTTEVVAHPVDCTHYIQCEFLKPIIRPCSGGLIFNPAVKACVKPSPDFFCSSLKPCDNINGGYFPHPTNCRFYIICDRGRTVVQSCKNNFLWDNVSKTCVLARDENECLV